jgi:hypothetical protein
VAYTRTTQVERELSALRGRYSVDIGDLLVVDVQSTQMPLSLDDWHMFETASNVHLPIAMLMAQLI